MHALILINGNAGSVAAIGAEKLAAQLGETAIGLGWTAEACIGSADELIAAARAAAPSTLLMCAGGDGTLAAIASVAMETGATFTPLPCGTMNLFCRDLGLPLDPVEAATAALSGRTLAVDLGIVSTPEEGERVFLNNIVLGPYAEIAQAREKLREADNIAETSAAIVEAASALINSAPGPHSIQLDDLSIARDTSTIVIGNNCYTECIDGAPRRASLTDGELALYVVAANGAASFAARMIEFLNGTLDKSDKIDLYKGRRCRVERRDGPTVFSVDGETRQTDGVLEMSIRPAALRVMVPEEARPSTVTPALANTTAATSQLEGAAAAARSFVRSCETILAGARWAPAP